MSNISIPADVAEHLQKAAAALKAHKVRLDFLHELWADEDPAPDWEWTVSIDHSEVETIAKNLSQVSEFLDWLANFSEEKQSPTTS